MRTFFIAAPILLLWTTLAVAAPGDPQSPYTRTVYELTLKDGSRVYGQVEGESDTELVFRTTAGAALTTPRARIVSLRPVVGRMIRGEFRREDPNGTRLAFGPTFATQVGSSFASKLAPGSDIGYMALIQEKLYEEKFGEALALVREGIGSGHRDYQMLSLLGTILMHSGAAPGQPAFAEAQKALETSVVANPMFSTSQIALGKLYLMEGRAKDAVAHLEIGRRLEPRNPAVYTSLARAYREIGQREKAQQSIAALSALLREKSTAGNSPPP